MPESKIYRVVEEITLNQKGFLENNFSLIHTNCVMEATEEKRTYCLSNCSKSFSLKPQTSISRYFKVKKFSFYLEQVFYGIELNNIPLTCLEDVVFSLSKYLLTKGDCDQSFSLNLKEKYQSPLEKSNWKKLIENIKSIDFSGELNDELVIQAFKFCKYSSYLKTGKSEYIFFPAPDRDVIQSICYLVSRVVGYLRDKLKDNIPQFRGLEKDKNCVVVEDSLIYFSTDSKSFLSEEIAQKAYSFFLKLFDHQTGILKLVIFNPRFNLEYSLNPPEYQELIFN